MASIFTRIVNSEIPCYRVAESEKCLAFLDINPLAEGHVLVIPKQEVDYLFNLPDELYSELMLFAKSVARAIEKVVPCERIGVTVIGLEVPHAHVHLIPINTLNDMNFARPKLQFTQQQFSELAASIAAAMS